MEPGSRWQTHSMDWSGTPDDPHGYFKLREFMVDAADRVDALGHAEMSQRLRVAGKWIGTPGEWMGECGLALRDALTVERIPNELRADLEDALAAIRVGFQRAGQSTSF